MSMLLRVFVNYFELQTECHAQEVFDLTKSYKLNHPHFVFFINFQVIV